MKYIMPVVKKELRLYFYSPIAYVVALVFLSVTGYFFSINCASFSTSAIQASASEVLRNFNPTEVIMSPIIGTMGTLFILLTPLMTMRLFAEEKKLRTIELLMTSPVSVSELVIGKYIASMIVYSMIISLSIYMPFTLNYFSSVNWGQVIAGYAGLLLMGSAMIAIGLFTSSLTDKQILAAVLGIGILVLFWFMGLATGALQRGVSNLMTNLSFLKHFNNMRSGLLDLRGIIFFISVTAAGLFLSMRVMEAHRWK